MNALPLFSSDIWFCIAGFTGEPSLFVLNREMQRQIYNSQKFWVQHLRMIVQVHQVGQIALLDRLLSLSPAQCEKDKVRTCFAKLLWDAKAFSCKTVDMQEMNLTNYSVLYQRVCSQREHPQPDPVEAHKQAIQAYLREERDSALDRLRPEVIDLGPTAVVVAPQTGTIFCVIS